jgi:hypothetical protein
MLVMFVTPDGKGIARNISEWPNVLQRRRSGKEMGGRNKKLRLADVEQ